MTEIDEIRAQDFSQLVAPLRGELHAHCYRMLGSVHDADDALQDALLRAWRALDGFEGRSTLRSWLYRIATNSCLDQIGRRGRRAMPVDLGPSSDHAVVGDVPLTDVAWLSPYPDARYEQREAVELAFVAALQHLPGNQRAALLLFEVLGFSAAEIATWMDTSTASVNSALQRARATVAEKVPPRDEHPAADARAREAVAAYASALEQGDVELLLSLLTEDVTWSMPPLPHWYRGRSAVAEFATTIAFACGSWRHVPTSANGHPAVASYLRRPDDDVHRAWSLDVLTLRGDLVAELTAFIGVEHFEAFGLPDTLP
ncbi:sigma-70 family RNA polymerase sigma factor [Cellulomonas fengjieae]|uniref:Sigma-70 family RNA polymerase sigma factor n=1 Tax=Cellulomonas fengjieae TaxID=2819978 RepID=A0ABS3SK47_9CELL|nr:sigma-70 family RNA polymerase sigma factor [Cellulomonas fengjieae]MBO3086042.1 sigma-70 family RNA polymerase sigma factor [Cellulomonas fengjieae]MBO3103992.1 sigma-70 family RNA polymerase sigma factor [Cellulomonas fengjieae]QVI65889.1 sigma-70 family RNA polymerase sigma factor [Cellulomonas fengjieae]